MLNIIVAPRSYNKNGEKHIKKIVKFLKQEKQEFSVYFLRAFSDMEATVKEIISFGETEFIIVGDDVVIHEFLNSTKDISKIKLGIVPTSKNDDFASYIGISSKPIVAISDIVKRNVCEVDLMLVNEVKAINNVVVGASVRVSEKYNEFKIKNKLSEKIAIMKYANKFEGEQLTLSTKNGKTKQENIYELVVANGGKNRGKLVSPLSNVKDGLFNLTYSDMATQSENKKNLKLFNKGKHIYQESTKQHWLSNLKITNEHNLIKASVDGKLMEFEKLEITLVEKGLKLYKLEK